jgi:NADH-quinone oxidoreductase subunit M
MIELHLPWLELSILIPLIGAIGVSRLRDAELARSRSIIFAGLTLLCAFGAWRDYQWLNVHIPHELQSLVAHDHWDILSRVFGRSVLEIDSLSAPLLPLAALLYLMTGVATLRTKVRRFSFSWTLASEAILLATLSCREPWLLTTLLIAGAVPPWLELRARGKSTRVYTLHMGAFALLLLSGLALTSAGSGGVIHSLIPVGLLTAAVLLRSGIVPVHCWMTDLFEKATFGTALLYVTPMVGAYAAVRLVLPIAPDWALRGLALVSLFTAVYAAGMALVQREARRFFCYLFLSHSSLVLVGLETTSAIGLTGALCVWLSVGLGLAGFGLTLRAMESRAGRISLAEHHGMHEHTPMLAAFFLLTGLASVGFPGTFGFVGTELLVDGVLHPLEARGFVERIYPYVGVAVVIAAALNGIAVVQAYFRLFAGARRTTTISLRCRPGERFAVLTLALLILGGGLWPQPGIVSRYAAAMEIVQLRRQRSQASHDLTPDLPSPRQQARKGAGESGTPLHGPAAERPQAILTYFLDDEQ